MSNKDENKPVIEWFSFPFIDFPKKSIILVLFLFFMGYILWNIAVVNWDQPLYYMLGVLILFIGIAPYFVPTKYEFYEYHLIIRYPIVKIEKRYSDYGSFYVDKKGIMLSTFKQVSRLDAFRGQSIRFSKDQSEREAIIVFLKERLIQL
ncbi:MAG: hypothetical protein RBS16_06380 [Candidatus Cloacimonadales bacterium]|jgi:hypothetical protein|nr:hypothetical protein [Candidatus Cloacimonadota bacterium]MDD3501315.1 hypothetical protein [Candidatus Cloacimonadota bacterium]MDX9977644.1 hypothetical protein [Candidatus Cloacimonadales bacterium]